MKEEPDFIRKVMAAFRISVMLFGILIFTYAVIFVLILDPNFFDPKTEPTPMVQVQEDIDPNLIENGIHVRTGLVEGEGLMTVVNNCTYCHSAKLVTQNRMSAERWNATIRWMQETQNLPDLDENQDIIVNYLTTYYPVQKIGRRATLTNIEWYELED